MIDLIFRYKRIFLSIFVTSTILGFVSWFTMPREEDPRLKNRFSNIQVIYPGATAEEVYRHVIKPLENKLARVDKLKSIEGTARSEFAFISLDLKSSVSDNNEINQAWDEVEDAIDKVFVDFPEGVSKPVLDRNSLDQDAIVISITSENDLQYLMKSIRELEGRLLSTNLVASVNRFADPDEAIRIDVDENKLKEIGIDILLLKQKLQLANLTVPSGSIKLKSKKLTIKTNSSFKSVEDIKNYVFELPNGENIKISDIAEVSRSIILPNERFFRFNGKGGISLGVVPQQNINLEKFGENVKSTLDSFSKEMPKLKVDTITFQPENVTTRLKELSQSLLIGIAIIGLALLVTMGLKMSLLAVILVPAIVFTALALFSFTNGALHQISIAAFVVSLGLLVDNVIVVLESIQDFLDNGLSKLEAAKKAVHTLALPLTAATGTTIASFIPMLGAAGTTADFTRSIPIVVVLSLLSSFAVSMLITPIFGMWFLKAGANRSWDKLNRAFGSIGEIPIKHSKRILILIFCLIALSFGLFPLVKKKFFNDADRSQLVVEIVVPEGSHYSLVDSIARRVESYLLERADVSSIGTYVGRGAPRFFYNLSLVPRSSHVSQMILTCSSPDAAKKMKDSLQLELDKRFPEAFILVRSLAQGPPTIAPIEYRLSGASPKIVSEATERLLNILRDTAGTTKVRSTEGIGVPILYFDINDGNSSKFSLERSTIGAKIFARTRGLEVGSYRYGQDVFPIILSNKKNENFTIDELAKMQIGQTVTGPVSLSTVSGARLYWEPSVIYSYNGVIINSIYSEIKNGHSVNAILKEVNEKIKSEPKMKNINIQLGGEAAESEEANTAILKVIPLGVLLLLISLLVQFNSLKKVIIILGATFPMFIGIWPGLIILQQPFGFFSLLGLLALIGIVVNNGILIVDQIDNYLMEGQPFDESVKNGVARRIRPIFLTTLTTVLGLLPLGFTNASLWPPFAWTMIFGLIASMIFTPLLVPAMYVFILKKGNQSKTSAPFIKSSVTILCLLLFLFPLDRVFASGNISLYDLVHHVENHPLLKSQNSKNYEKADEADRLRAQMFLPSVGVNAQRLHYNKNREFQTPIGNFGGIGLDQTNISLRLKQSIYNPRLWHGEVESADFEEKSSVATTNRLKHLLLSNVLKVYSQQIQLKLKIESLKKLVEKLKKQRNEISRLLTFGRVSELDLLKIDLVINENLSTLFTLNKEFEASKKAFGTALGLNEPQNAIELNTSVNVIEKFSFAQTQKKSRSDVNALNFKIESFNSKIKSISFSRLPEISFIGSYSWENPSAFNSNNLGVVGIELSWDVWNSNERSYQKSRVNHLRTSLEYAKEDLLNNIDSEKTFYQARLLSLVNRWPQIENDFKRAKEVVSLENGRYFNGKSSLNELLDAEILNQKKLEDVLIYPYEYLFNWASYQESTDFPDLEKLKGSRL